MNSINNTNIYYGLCGFLSGGILIYLFRQYKINNLEKKIKELEETNINLIEHMMFMDSTPCNSSHKKVDEFNIYYSNYDSHF